MARLSLALAALVTATAALGCNPPAEAPGAPQWIDLAHGYQPRPLEELALRLEAQIQPARDGRVLRRGADGKELWFEVPLPRARWQRAEAAEPAADGPDDAEPAATEPEAASQVWRTPLPAGGALLAGEHTSQVVVDGDQPLKKGISRLGRAGRFWIDEKQLEISVGTGEEPPDTLAYRVRLDSGHTVDGVSRGTQWDLSCNGFVVFPGEGVSLTTVLPPASRLCFATVSPDPGGDGAELGPTTFRVLLDGKVLLEHVQAYARPVHARWHRLELPATKAGSVHELRFEIEGEAPALIANPQLGPDDIGRPGARPWAESRPDVVLVLCDTFRADNLAAWGGKPELAPALNRFVERSLHFLDARAAAAWTLPSIATILAGVFPGQHGATDLDRGVSPAAETLAEVLGRAGYRTAAITDSGLFSRHYGQDQGFEWFQETLVADWNLTHSLARARAQLAADDGRPLFLVVHTYRVHGPMRVGPQEDLGPYQDLRRRVRARMDELEASEGEFRKMDVALEFAPEGLRMYEDAVRDLDAKVGAWIAELEREGFFERGQLVLTADHGNAHGEHGQVGHGSDLYDVKLRVPLAFAGRGVPARAVAGPVSLVNLAPTVTALAGVAPAASWVGRSLLESVPSGPVYAFDLKKRGRQVALYAEGRKLMAEDVEALRAGRPSHAFDLGADPGENHNLAESTSWPAELGRALAATLEPLLVPAAEGQTLELSPEVLEQLRNIGYGGE